jgi:hypothetical protein
MVWPSEEIPDADGLYVRFLQEHLDDSATKLQPNFFRARGSGMSSDWTKYGSPKSTRNAPTATNRPPEQFGVAELSVSAVRNVSGLSVIHTPKVENRAHTDILGLSKEEVSSLLVTIRRELLVTTIKQIHLLPGDAAT